MQIKLSQHDVEEAIKLYVESRGMIGSVTDIEFTQTRKPKNITCDITLGTNKYSTKVVQPDNEITVTGSETTSAVEPVQEEQPSGNLFKAS